MIAAYRPDRGGGQLAQCRCCGSIDNVTAHAAIRAGMTRQQVDQALAGSFRCAQHADRNPCAIEGCTRTMPAGGHLADDWSLCGAHWRALVPKGSPERRAYLRIRRTAKKLGGWTRELARRHDRIWDAIVRRARARAAGDIDQAEIERLFGWDR